jgi:HEAT repeat protein
MTPDRDDPHNRSPSLPHHSAAARDEATGLEPAMPGAATPESVFAEVDGLLRRAAAEPGRRGEILAGAAASLARLLECPVDGVRARAADGLYQIVEAPGAAEALNTHMADAAVLEAVYTAARMDGQGGACEEAAPLAAGLAAVLRSGPGELRGTALGALMRFHRAALAPAVPALAETLSDPDPRMRLYAALTLSSAEFEGAHPSVPRIAEALARADDETAVYLLAALERCGSIPAPAAEAVIPVIESRLSWPDRRVALSAAKCLAGVGAGRRALRFLTGVLRGEIAVDAAYLPEAAAARALSLIVPEGLDALREAVAPGSPAPPAVRWAAAEELAPHDPDAVLPLLREGLGSPSRDDRWRSLQRCWAVRGLVGPLYADLLAMTRDADPYLRRQAVSLLERTRPPAGAVAALAALLDDPDRRGWAARRLAELGRDAAAALPALEELASLPEVGRNAGGLRDVRRAAERIRGEGGSP